MIGTEISSFVYIGRELVYANMFLSDEDWTREEIIEDALDSLASAIYTRDPLNGGSVDDVKRTLMSGLDIEDLWSGSSDIWVTDKYDYRIDIVES